jgi:MFS family permease
MRGIEISALSFLMDWIVGASSIVVSLFAIRLGANPFVLGILGFTWGVSYSSMSPLFGRISSEGRRKPMILTGISVVMVSMLLYGISSKPIHLILTNLVNGLGCSLFWPIFETLLHVRGDSRRTNRNMGFFNIGWTTGLTAGTAMGGAMMALGERNAFSVMALVLGITFLLALIFVKEEATSYDPPKGVREDRVGQEARTLLYISWIANFVVWFGTSTVTTLFPKLAKSYGFSDLHVGLFSSFLNLGQGVAFIGLMISSRWHFKLLPLLISQIVASLGISLIGLLRTPPGFCSGLLLLGLGRGLCYSSSLYYALVAGGQEGGRTGIHEMLVGGAFTLGPFVGGSIAQWQGIRVSFLFSSALLILALPIQIHLRSGPLRKWIQERRRYR